MRTTMEPADVAGETLKQWVRQYKVTWEVSPQREMVDGAALQVVGYEIRLYGVVASEGGSPEAEEVRATYERLRAIAHAVLPVAGGHTRCEVERFDSSIHMRPDSEWLPEVEVTIHLSHRRSYSTPPDAAEKRIADGIQESLRQLGAQPGRWTKAR